MPGLLNHITGTLDELEAMMPDQDNLMKTIRMPRRLGEITERMPAPQYDQPSFKRTNSQPQTKLEVIDTESGKKLMTGSKATRVSVAKNSEISDTPLADGKS